MDIPRTGLSQFRNFSRTGLSIRWTGDVVAVIPMLAFVFVRAALVIKALPVIKFKGLHFFTAT